MTHEEDSFDEAVELGLPDGPLDEHEQEDLFTSKIGGRPTWMRATPETEKGIACGICGAALFLLLQMDCPPAEAASPVDRVIYVFACNTRECTESGNNKAFRVLVQCRRTGKKPAGTGATKLAAGLWDSIMADESATTAISEAIEKVTLEEAEDGGDAAGIYASKYPAGFPSTALRIVDELISVRPARPSARDLQQQQAMADEDPAAAGEGWQGELYEKMQISGYDKAFKAFHTRIAHYPRQCVRYSPGGRPLPFCADEIPAAPPCNQCGGERKFELQLMPAIFAGLPKEEDKYLKHISKGRRGKHPFFGDSMEWGTIMVYSCGSCTLLRQPTGDFCEFEGFPIAQIEKDL